MKRYKKLLIALAAIASIYLVRATGLDRGLIDAVLKEAIEVIVEPESAPESNSPDFGEKAEPSPDSAEEPNVPANHFANPERCSDCHK